MKEQTPEGYIIEEKLLQFNIDEERYDSALEISLDKQRAEDRKWMITLQSENKVHTGPGECMYGPFLTSPKFASAGLC